MLHSRRINPAVKSNKKHQQQSIPKCLRTRFVNQIQGRRKFSVFSECERPLTNPLNKTPEQTVKKLPPFGATLKFSIVLKNTSNSETSLT